jgi:hypothetical protein
MRTWEWTLRSNCGGVAYREQVSSCAVAASSELYPIDFPRKPVQRVRLIASTPNHTAAQTQTHERRQKEPVTLVAGGHDFNAVPAEKRYRWQGVDGLAGQVSGF